MRLGRYSAPHIVSGERKLVQRMMYVVLNASVGAIEHARVVKLQKLMRCRLATAE